MARGRKGGPSRMDMRRQAEAAEARGKDDEPEEEEEEAEEEAEADEGDGEEEAKPKPKPKPKKKPAAPKKPAAKRVRAVKEVRRRAVWVVYDNSQKPVDSFPFSQKADAEALLARKMEEKKGTFYLNLVKEEIKE